MSSTNQISAQLKKGVLDLCVLALLNKEDSYAYDIAKALAITIQMGEGTIYPLMRRLQNDGFVESYLQESSSGPPRKYYKITNSGREVFITYQNEWQQFSNAINSILGESL